MEDLVKRVLIGKEVTFGEDGLISEMALLVKYKYRSTN